MYRPGRHCVQCPVLLRSFNCINLWDGIAIVPFCRGGLRGSEMLKNLLEADEDSRARIQAQVGLGLQSACSHCHAHQA